MTSTERKITDTVIALESLLLDDNQEVKFKFAMRGAQILGLLNYPSLKVNQCLKVAYDIRSAYVHGSDVDLAKNLKKLDGKDRGFEFEILFTFELLDYCRLLLLVTIFMCAKEDFVKTSKKSVKAFDKQKFLSIVDDSCISPASEVKLRELLDLPQYCFFSEN
jgi:hypothetical protein